jgi:rod shape determining protein RodA
MLYDTLMGTLSEEKKGIDWILFAATIPLLAAGLVTMSSFGGPVVTTIAGVAGTTSAAVGGAFFIRQIIWIIIALGVFFACSFIDFHFLRRTWVSVILFIGSCAMLSLLFLIGHVSRGAASWFSLGAFSFQPSDLVKLALVIILAKYFSRRHIEIANIRHILVSGSYALIICILVLIQPALGSAIIIFLIWLGMVLVSGISKKHLLIMALTAVAVFGILWTVGFKEYQRDRILNFIHPLTDIHDTGYNAYQSAIAVGSGGLFGKGVGYGTQSRLKFLPEYQTDFIFAAFAEEWGFVGVFIMFCLFGVVIWRVIRIARSGATNFEILFGTGVAILIIVQFIINVGMNIELLPVTGTTLPFVSYGGTHLLTEFAGLGIMMGMRRYGRVAHKEMGKDEFVGI